MSKKSIAWHEECANNFRHSYERRLVERERLNDEVERMRVQMLIYEDQIREAKARGLEGFDQDKFMKKRIT